MKNRYKILVVVAITITSLLASDQYYLSFQDKELKKSDWVQNCLPVEDNQIVPSIGLYNHTHSFDLRTCTWHHTEHGAPGFLESLYVSFVEPLFIDVADSLEVKQAYAACAATILPQPCFDAFMGSTEPMTQKSIMENYARNIESRYTDWQMSDRKWDDTDTPLRLPAIICTEFVADGIKHYRMAKWVDSQTISSFENHRNDFLCNKWLAPIDDGVKIRWDKTRYLPNDVGVVRIYDNGVNQYEQKTDSFDIHVWSDIDHTGIELTVTKTDGSSGIFEGTVFFIPEGKSKDTTLLVEDAVYAEHKFSVGSARIINESKDIVLEEPYADNSQDTKNPNECWYQDDTGNMVPCTIDSTGPSMIVGMFLVVFWPYVVLGIVIGIIFIIWRKKRK